MKTDGEELGFTLINFMADYSVGLWWCALIKYPCLNTLCCVTADGQNAMMMKTERGWTNGKRIQRNWLQCNFCELTDFQICCSFHCWRTPKILRSDRWLPSMAIRPCLAWLRSCQKQLSAKCEVMIPGLFFISTMSMHRGRMPTAGGRPSQDVSLIIVAKLEKIQNFYHHLSDCFLNPAVWCHSAGTTWKHVSKALWQPGLRNPSTLQRRKWCSQTLMMLMCILEIKFN